MAEPRQNPNRPHRRVYGRRQGRPLHRDRRDSLDRLLPALGIPAELLTEKGDLDPARLFAAVPRQIWFEIGFGNGEHLTELMHRHPDFGFIGAEPFMNGMSRFLKDIRNLPHDNVRVLMDDAMLVGTSLAARSLDGIYILNPDPWPKTRHHKRRIVNPANLDQFARILKPGGVLILSTDVPDLAEWMLTATFRHPAFEWTAETARDWEIPPADWIPTRYERKGAKGAKRMVYLRFVRKNIS